MTTLKEFFATRDQLTDEVFKAEPGEARLKAFAKFEHRDHSQVDIESEVSRNLCYCLTYFKMADEIIEMRAAAAVRRRDDAASRCRTSRN
jgi:hypothetical protein